MIRGRVGASRAGRRLLEEREKPRGFGGVAKLWKGVFADDGPAHGLNLPRQQQQHPQSHAGDRVDAGEVERHLNPRLRQFEDALAILIRERAVEPTGELDDRGLAVRADGRFHGAKSKKSVGRRRGQRDSLASRL